MPVRGRGDGGNQLPIAFQGDCSIGPRAGNIHKNYLFLVRPGAGNHCGDNISGDSVYIDAIGKICKGVEIGPGRGLLAVYRVGTKEGSSFQRSKSR